MLAFWCPGCKTCHAVTLAGWKFNGDAERPTFSPSVLVRSGHYIPQHGPECWCTYNAKHTEAPSRFKCSQCHSFVTDGRIQFLSDCSHELAGQTLDLPEFP